MWKHGTIHNPTSHFAYVRCLSELSLGGGHMTLPPHPFTWSVQIVPGIQPAGGKGW
jgi:hypothetical protein